jgi:hypothetical protein
MSKENNVEQEIITDPGTITRLLIEYEQCNQGYNSRDVIAGDEFSKLIESFFYFLALLLAINVLSTMNNYLRIFFCSMMGILGFISFLSLLLDIEGASSCKVALRHRALEIEDIFSHSNTPLLWKSIEDRSKFFEERGLKKKSEAEKKKKTEKETEGDLFIMGGRIFIALWIIIVIVISILGGTIKLPSITI